jgi:CubicO group peptidase (beta-lactamase class C family)
MARTRLDVPSREKAVPRKRLMRLVALMTVFVVAMSGATTPTATAGNHAAPVPDDPGADSWVQVPRDRVAEECGLDPDLLEVADAAFPTSSYTIVRFGKLCWTGGNGPSTTSRYPVWSVTKTFGAVLVGMVAARSSLSDTDLASEWLTPAQMGTSSPFTPTPINPDATVAHMLGTTSTKANLAVDQKGAWAYDLIGSREINRLRDVINAVIAREPENFPGVSNVFEFAQQEVFPVLGMENSLWPSPGTAIFGGGNALGAGLHSTVDDISRLGLLMLRKGNWDGVQLIEEEFVYRMTHPSFADTNSGYGYLTWLNSATLSPGIAGTTPDNVCAPYATWPEHPHRPFYETTHDYGGSPFDEQPFDIGVAFAAGLGGQLTIVHRGLDMVISGRDVSGGPQGLWTAVRPALVALDPVYAGDEDAFCDAYRRSAYAPTLISGWAPRNKEACRNGGWRYGAYRNQGACVASFASTRG